jgi:hypothetical protein
LLSQDEHLVRGPRLLLDDHGAADGHNQGDDAIDPLGGAVVGGSRSPAVFRATAMLAGIQTITE